MNIKNTVENLIIAFVTVVLTVVVINMTSIKPMQHQIQAQSELILELAKIEKYKIDNSFDKVKAKDGQIDLKIDSKIEQLEAVSDSAANSTDTHKKKGFFKRIFGK